jgi:hypothetical protein
VEIFWFSLILIEAEVSPYKFMPIPTSALGTFPTFNSAFKVIRSWTKTLANINVGVRKLTANLR